MKNFDIIHGDCLPELINLSRNGVRATLIFADPPYNLGLDYGSTTNDKMSRGDYTRWCRKWISECYFNLLDHGSLWLLINHENAADLEIQARDIGFTVANYITWYESFGVNRSNGFTRSSRRLFHLIKDPKNYIFNKEYITRPSARQEIYNDKRANPAGRIWDDVWGINPEIPRVCGTHAERIPGFPTQLPLKLLYPIIFCASNQGDLVIDPFSGSGTTGEACVILNRKYIGIEINPDYSELSRDRLARRKTE